VVDIQVGKLRAVRFVADIALIHWTVRTSDSVVKRSIRTIFYGGNNILTLHPGLTEDARHEADLGRESYWLRIHSI